MTNKQTRQDKTSEMTSRKRAPSGALVEKVVFLVFLVTCLHKKARARAHVHMGHVARCQPHRGDAHGARKKNLSRFG